MNETIMNRRQAVTGMGASLVVLPSAVWPAEAVRQKAILATEKAIRFLNVVGEFLPEEAEQARKAICKRHLQDEERWHDTFMATASHTFWLTHYSKNVIWTHEALMYWQAVRLSFLLGTDGFQLLQIPQENYDHMIQVAQAVKGVDSHFDAIEKIRAIQALS